MSNSNNILSQPYAQWLEKALKTMIDIPVNGICLIAVTDTGDIYTNYHQIGMMDKIKIAGIVQQDAMLDTLAGNGLIEFVDEEEEAIGEEKE